MMEAIKHDDKYLRDLEWLVQNIQSETNLNLIRRVSFSVISDLPSSSSSSSSSCACSSCCYQIETDKYMSSSLDINIFEHSQCFLSVLLSLLSTTASQYSSLRELHLRHIKWDDSQQMHSLVLLLLHNTPTITQIVFNNNNFNNLDCLSIFSDMLTKNDKLKEVIFSESHLGPLGASLLASALQLNTSLEELQIWEDSVGSRGAEELSKMIEINSSLKLLTIFDSTPRTATPLISSVLARNRHMELHIWSQLEPPPRGGGGGGQGQTKVAELLIVPDHQHQHHHQNNNNSTTTTTLLRVYRLDASGSCRVACSLGMNSTVRSLDLTGIRLNTKWAKEFRWVLEQNTVLRDVNISSTSLKDKGVVYIAAGLFKNKTLQRLSLHGNCFSGIGVEHLLCPFTRFSALQLQANLTLNALTFGGRKTKIGRQGLASILQMLTTNQSLTRLSIYDDESLRSEDFVKMFKNLEMNNNNARLRHLSLQGCKGVNGELLLQAIMSTLQVNPWLQELDLARTPLQSSGKTEGIYKKLGQNEKMETDSIELINVDLLKDMPMVVPKSSCRVFFCGQEHAGKTTLCNSVARNFSSSSKLPYMDHIRTLVNPVEEVVKGGGMKIKTFKDELGTKISLWNLAGQQHELYALHDLMFPAGHGSSSASFFVVVVSLDTITKSPPQTAMATVPVNIIEDDIKYWLRFIVSNSKRAAHAAEAAATPLPHVTLVLTHYDQINLSSSESLQATVHSIQRLRDKFNGYVEFYPTAFTVDARSSASVSKLAHHLRATSKTILQRVPRVYELCNDLIQLLSNWRIDNSNKPSMRWKEFEQLCQVKIPSLRVIRSRNGDQQAEKVVETRRRAVASYMHHIGEVIFFNELEFLILDIEWFCGEVLGQLMAGLDIRKRGGGGGRGNNITTTGFLSRKDLEKILKENLQQSNIPGMGNKLLDDLDASDLVRMMLKLELCYEQEDSSSSSSSGPNSMLFIPSILEQGRGGRRRRWDFTTPPDCVFVGRHLECDDSSLTFLTPGFFPRLQVHLHNRVMALKNQHGATYSLEKYLISITIDGIHVRVELGSGGQLGYYVDILASSSTKTLTEIVNLFRHLIIPSILSLCQGEGGGVMLTENVIRPECVRNLTPPRYRKTQFVPLHRLKEALLTVPADNMYDYQHTWDQVLDSTSGGGGDGGGGRTVVLRQGFDLARDILSDDEFREVVHRRYHDLYNLAMELDFPTNTEHNSSPEEEEENIVDPSLGGIAKGVEAVLRRLKIMEQEMRDVKQEIQGLRYYEHGLLVELHRKVLYLVNFNVEVEERKFPNMFFFVETEKYSTRRLVTKLISGMAALRLHMLCEYRQEMHVVEDQVGCQVLKVDNRAVKCVAPYMKKFMKLLTFALKIGAHLAAGMGSMIPDLSREVAHLVDVSIVLSGGGGAGAVAVAAGGGGALGAAAAVGNYRDSRNNSNSTTTGHDQKAAQQWLMDFLRDEKCWSGREVAEKFGLWRVRYRDSGQIAWICRHHMYSRSNQVHQLPI
ncbi:protein TORNADO 1 [Impatiens glandulifera]|uniref:protein TORNADO 1 n=1 Tax=Impatiens glandulifera TaxID=253017 RepID=UPI001FB052E5|nr:protein TORNADO 1 [Impatiens glandulifera]